MSLLSDPEMVGGELYDLHEEIDSLRAQLAAVTAALAKCPVPVFMHNSGSYSTMYYCCTVCRERGEYLTEMKLEDHAPDCAWRKAKEMEK